MNLIKNKFYKIWLSLKGNSYLYWLNALLKSKSHLLVNKKNDLCVAGYPRSANTFTTVFLKKANETLNIAHHTHSIANLKLSIKYDIPTVILIRNPLDCISSYIIRENITIENAINEYLWFYSYVKKERGSFLLLPFETAVKKPEQILKLIENNTNINFNIKTNSDKVEKIQDRALQKIKEKSSKWNKSNNRNNYEKIAIPNNRRDDMKKETKQEIKQIYSYKEAKKLYKNLLKDLNKEWGE